MLTYDYLILIGIFTQNKDVTYNISYFQMRSTSKKKSQGSNNLGGAPLKVNVPTFKFEKADHFSKMYEEAFE